MRYSLIRQFVHVARLKLYVCFRKVMHLRRLHRSTFPTALPVPAREETEARMVYLAEISSNYLFKVQPKQGHDDKAHNQHLKADHTREIAVLFVQVVCLNAQTIQLHTGNHFDRLRHS